MTPASSILDPNSDPALYVAAVLTIYVDLPDTPLRASVTESVTACSTWSGSMRNLCFMCSLLVLMNV